MSYVLIFPIIIFLLFIYYILGNVIFNLVDIRRNSFAAKIVFGWIMVICISCGVGVPCQFAGSSWEFFSFVFSIIFLLIIVASFKFIKVSFKESINFEKLKIRIKNNIQQYWFIYLVSFIFTIFSITNLLSYYGNNYGDDHYIVQIVHLVNSKHLLDFDPTMGIIYNYQGRHNFFAENGYKMLNTYQLLYAYIASVFRVNIVFFCRVIITFLNYLCVFFTFQLLSSIWLEEKYSQYGLVLIPLFLIPQGYAARGDLPFRIRMFENWRFQTAIYMGGSITRLCSFPLLLYFLNLCFQIKEKYQFKFGLILLISVFLIANQTTGISYILLMIPLFILGFLLYSLFNSKNRRKKIILLNICIIYTLVLIFGINIALSKMSTDNYLSLIKKVANGLDINNLIKSANEYQKYYNDSFIYDIFMNLSFIPISFLIFIDKNRYSQIVGIVALLIYLIFKLNKTNLFLSLISFVFFGTARMLTGSLVLSSILTGILIIRILNQLLHNLKCNRIDIISGFITLCMVISCVSFIKINKKNILNYTQPGDGIVKEGYSFIPLLCNNAMIPNMFYEVGKYFDNMPDDNYSVIAEENIECKGIRYQRNSLYMSSRKIVYNNLNKSYGDENQKFWDSVSYFKGYLENSIYVFDKYYFNMAKIQYVFTTRRSVKNNLVLNNFKCVVGGNKKGYWLMKYMGTY